MPTIKDVARLASTSVSTVSIILNGRAAERKISASTQERVRRAIAELGYTPNRSAQDLRTAERKPIVALFWATDWRAALLARFLRGLEEGAASLASPIEIVVQPYPTGRLAEQQQLAGVPPFDGAIIGNASGVDLAFLAESRPLAPCVLYNRPLDGYPGIAVDDARVGALAAEALAGAQRLAILTADTTFAGMTAREDALAAAIRREGRVVETIPLSAMTADAGYAATRTLLTERQVDARPDALFAPSDTVALGALAACRDLGIAVPDDLAVAAVGNGLPEYAAYSAPALTTVEIPLEEMAHGCLDLLMEEIASAHRTHGSEGNRAPQQRFVEPVLVRRASTRS